MAPLLFDLDLAVCLTLTMSRAWDLELVLLAAVGSWVLSLFPLYKFIHNIRNLSADKLPRCNSRITSSVLRVAISDKPATFGNYSCDFFNQFFVSSSCLDIPSFGLIPQFKVSCGRIKEISNVFIVNFQIRHCDLKFKINVNIF